MYQPESSLDRRPNDRRAITRRATLATVGAGVSAGLAGCVGSVFGNEETFTVDYHPYYSQAFSALVIKHGELWRDHLPDEYDVNWHAVLQGAPTVNRLISHETDLGYMGDNPAIIAAANEDTDISVVGLSGYSLGQQGLLCVAGPNSAVETPADLDGLDVNVTQGTIAHRFLQTVVAAEGIDVNVRDQDINSIVSNLREESIDIAFGWEPSIARVVYQDEAAEYLFSGAAYDEPDLGALVVPDAVLDDHWDAAVGWFKAELEAKHILANDRERALDYGLEEEELSRDLDRDTVERSLYEPVPVNDNEVRLEFVTDFSEIDLATELLTERGPAFLREEVEVIDREPSADRFNTELVAAAVDELADEVDWNPHRAGDRP